MSEGRINTYRSIQRSAAVKTAVGRSIGMQRSRMWVKLASLDDWFSKGDSTDLENLFPFSFVLKNLVIVS